MSKSIHSVYGGSSASRWTTCTASIHEIAKMPEVPSSEYAVEGTLAHEVARLALEREIPVLDILAKNPLVKHALDYAAYVKDILGVVSYEQSLRIEEPVDYTHVIPDPPGFGTPDAWATKVINGETRCYVFDYKYGAGVKVSPENNTQLLTYAVGIRRSLQVDKEAEIPTSWEFHIYQPRMNNIAVWETTGWVIQQWQKKMWQSYQESQSPDLRKYQPSVSNCKWCPALIVCEAARKEVYPILKKNDKDIEIDETAYKLLRNKDMIYSYLRALEQHIVSLLLIGTEIPGFEITTTKKRKTWKSNAEDILYTRHGDAVFKRSLLGITEMRKKLIDDDLIDKLVFTPAGDPKLKILNEFEMKKQALKGEF